MTERLLYEEESHSLPQVVRRDPDQHHEHFAPPLTEYSLDQSLGDSLGSTSAPVYTGGQKGIQQPKKGRPKEKQYIQAIGTPEAYQYERTNEQPQDGYTAFGFTDESIERADRMGGPAFMATPPPMARPYSPWTPRGAVLFAQDKIKAGSVKGSVFNMIIATVGGGMLSLPFGVRMFGLVPGFLLLIFSGWLSYQTNDFLLIAAQHLKRGVKPTHLNLAKACSPKWGNKLANFTQMMLLVQMFGAIVSYNVGFGGLMDLVWGVIVPDSAPSHVYPFVVVIITWGIVYPLALMRSMAAMRFTSLLGFVCSSYLALVLFFEYFALCNNQEIEPQKTCFWASGFKLRFKDLFNFKDFGHFFQQLLVAVPYFIFSYTNHQYTLPVYVELTKQSRRTMQKVVRNAHCIIFVQYTLSTFFSFLSFLDGTCGNILLNNFHERADAVIAAVAISTSMILTQPVTAFAWRMNFAEIFYDVKQLPKKQHILSTTALLFVAMVISLLVTDIATVIGLLGATTYPMVGYILPATYMWFLVPANGPFRVHRYMALLQAVFISLLSIGSLFMQVYGMTGKMKHQGDCHNVQSIKASSFF